MKITNTQSQIDTLKAALAVVYAPRFSSKSCDPKCDAQRNLSGLTHYVDDSTLRFHHSRVIDCTTFADGLLLKITTSDAMDMHNTKRGFRCVVFDVFGTAVYRPELEQSAKTSKAAHHACDAVEFDVVAHYKATLASQLERKQSELSELSKAISTLS